MTTIQDIPLKRIDGSADTLAAHKGKVLLSGGADPRREGEALGD